jgi:polyhydroxyalkanoate synthesis regulator phasin|tara:strand:+ start:201 stop:509 length:309 start_codon:yes stop_codon:yes gene_type:complete
MVTIIKQSGNPVDESEAKKFLDEWKEGFDKLFDAKGDMAIVSEKAKAFEEELLKKYKVEKQVNLPKSMKAWKKLLDDHQSGIMVDQHAKTGELMFVILDQGL